ncbi:hypothetical protein, partial [Escherichia coli]
QGDMTQYGGPIVQGSAGVRIGAPTGVACSVCPGGMTSGNPVNRRETVRYRYDDAHSELPATTTDATGSTRQMTWSRYGQLLAFTDC